MINVLLTVGVYILAITVGGLAGLGVYSLIDSIRWHNYIKKHFKNKDRA